MAPKKRPAAADEEGASPKRAKAPSPAEGGAAAPLQRSASMKPKEIAALIEASTPWAASLRKPAAGEPKLRLLSWNVNGLASVLKKDPEAIKRLLPDADVLFLQETKLQEKDVDQWREMCVADGWSGHWVCSQEKLGYSGVAAFWRTSLGGEVLDGIGLEEADKEGRCLILQLPDMYVLGCYVPNSGEELRRLDFRIGQWEATVAKKIRELSETKPVVYCGDLNVSHCELDLWGNHAANSKSAGYSPEERKAFSQLLESCEMVDSFRHVHPDVRAFTYWSFRSNARAKNNGWRLDYVLVPKGLAPSVHDAFILPDVMGSDHCPIGCTLV